MPFSRGQLLAVSFLVLIRLGNSCHPSGLSSGAAFPKRPSWAPLCVPIPLSLLGLSPPLPLPPLLSCELPKGRAGLGRRCPEASARLPDGPGSSHTLGSTHRGPCSRGRGSSWALPCIFGLSTRGQAMPPLPLVAAPPILSPSTLSLGTLGAWGSLTELPGV